MINLEEEYDNLKEVPNHGLCGNLRLMFTSAVVVGLDQYGYDRRYCYHTMDEAVKALKEWDGLREHPSGNWIKCKGSCNNLRNKNYQEINGD